MYLKNYNLKNKTAVVTGAGKGLGKACAIALAEAGANLIIISRTNKDLTQVSKIIKKLKVKCKSYVCDITNYEEIKEIINKQNKIEFEEGCLSVPGFYEKVERYNNITFKAQLTNGDTYNRDVEGLLSVCVQHEIDHLDGKLFVDYVSKTKRQLIRKKLKKTNASRSGSK